MILSLKQQLLQSTFKHQDQVQEKEGGEIFIIDQHRDKIFDLEFNN